MSGSEVGTIPSKSSLETKSFEVPPEMTKAYSYIRMSTQKQIKGDSLRRQVAEAAKYAEAHGLVLDDTFRLTDIGYSAFSGSHIRKGALGYFLQAIRDGKIDPGAELLVESLDRLSREDPLKALGTFVEILSHGISIITLTDGRALRPGGGHDNDLNYMIGVLTRSHEESKTKSYRKKHSHQNKLANVRLDCF